MLIFLIGGMTLVCENSDLHRALAITSQRLVGEVERRKETIYSPGATNY